MAGRLNQILNPQVSRHLISDEGEIVIDEVRRHLVAYVPPALIMLAGVVIMVSSLWAPVEVGWLPLAIGLVVLVVGGYRVLLTHMDRFVITNMRVFRVHGVLSQHIATMPMARILDISVHKPFIGRIFRFGHFVFESAAQDQGLRDIRYVARPDERDLTIQRVIQRSGLRSSMRPVDPASAVDPAGMTDLAGPSRSRPGAGPASGATPQRRDQDRAEPDAGDDRSPDEGDSDQGGRHDADLEWLHAGWTERDQAEHERALGVTGESEFDRAARRPDDEQE